MRKLITAAALVAIVLCQPGCGKETKKPAGKPAEKPKETQDDKQWRVAKGVLDGNKEMAELLKGITDEATAKAAAPKLKALTAKIEAFGKQMEAFAEPTEALKQRMTKEYLPAMQAAQAAMMAEMKRLSEKPKLLALIKDSLPS